MPTALATDWNALVFGSFSQDEVLRAVADPGWQGLRESLLGTTRAVKYATLEEWVRSAPLEERRRREVQVTNYVHALKRGGIIK